METKKLIGAIVASFIILWIAGYLVHVVWLGEAYREMRTAGMSFRPEDMLQHKLWLVWVGDLLYAILFVWVYTKGMETKPWVAQGVRYGILMTLFTVVPNTLYEYVSWMIPYRLALDWMIAGFITLIIMGLATAGIYKKAPA